MINNIPKVTIYKLSKVTAGYPIIEVYLQFRNPNMGQALISFEPLTEEQHLELASRNEIFDIELPKFEFKVDPSEAYLD